jgi:uncharacterized protein YxjI
VNEHALTIRRNGGLATASLRDDFFLEDQDGDRVFTMNGKALRVRETLVLESLQGHVLCQIQERMMRIKDSVDIEGASGERLAMATMMC